MTTDQTKPNADSLDGGDSIQTTLDELWELLGKGTHEAWAKEVERMDDGSFVLCLPDTNHDSYADLDDRLLYAIARDHIEGWLDSLEWKMYRSNGVTKYCPPITGQFYSLTDAVRYALNHPPHDGQRPGN